ncbi:MAG: hypothetical protein K2Q24_13120 [Chitinophagaceae bacterium]|nr:hypothetical protein [Chitinophagaceae bacterium]
MTAPKISNNARLISLFSFILGTGIFALYYFTDSSSLLFLGLGFIIVAGIVNLIFFILLIRQTLKTKDNKRNLYTTCGLMLLNIPIMLFYCWLTTVLLNTMRITFVNETASTLTDIKIFGCEEKHLNKLEPNEKKLVWIRITGDCSVNIEFKKDGKVESENVSGYTTNNMGQRMTHKIGWENAPANY